MVKTLDKPDVGGNRNMHQHDEIDLTNLDYRALTPEQWELVKRQAVRRAQAERAQMINEMVRRLIFWRGKSAATAPPRPDPTGCSSVALAN
jgi:hypothetical protein